ncbi:TAXI family TRAP transporter solute-binding subunit [Hyphococcus luteus]|uniref:C4-dicarboxylate ABC transporter substrate-binding protein n=1 Tax=Hyphococcus luteus TaxID=2058213 RepID=A0A2S7K550_9PROT|nr:TAXI family TRAP transporter solute-binding subunit [Marinicaulis flavus]PQA87619.1 hypothetical protein CW354_11115 [Marinicaulis flavus]
MIRAQNLIAAACLLFAAPVMAEQSGGPVGETIEVGDTGWANKRPVFAAACPQGCPWGELGEFLKEAMAGYGYDIVLCRNCNRDRAPRLVSEAGAPPALQESDLEHGTKTRFDAPVDFGITASGMLADAYHGRGVYAKDGPYENLRLIARIEDPTFLLAAVHPDSDIASLDDIRKNKTPVKILAFGQGANEVLAYYGLTRENVEKWGGSINLGMGADADTEFDVIIDDLASPAQNLESVHWTNLSYAHDLVFLQLPDALLEDLAAQDDYQHVTVKWGLLRGVDREIETVGRNGEAFFARADTPDGAAYDIAKAIDEARGDLIWLIRRYSLEPRAVFKNQGVPLHPGAERYYRERGYIK